MDEEVTPKIEQTNTVDPGVADGAVVLSGTVEEVIVYDYDPAGNQIGWHKEVKDNG